MNKDKVLGFVESAWVLGEAVVDDVKSLIEDAPWNEGREEEEEADSGPGNRFDGYPAGTVVSTVIDYGGYGKKSYFHVKQGDGTWNEFDIRVSPNGSGVELEASGFVSSDELVGFESHPRWTTTVLKED